MSMPDLKGLIETAQRIQAEVARVREDLAAKTVEGETGGGMVRCVANGKGEIVSIRVDPSIVIAGEEQPGSETLKPSLQLVGKI